MRLWRRPGLNMDEEPGAVINRLLEDGDVQIIDPPPPPSPLSANVVRHPVQQALAPRISYFLGFGPPKNQRNEIQPLDFLFPVILVRPKNQEVRNPALDFLFPLFLVEIHIKSSTLHALPSGSFRNSRRFAAGILSPSKRPDIKSSLLLLAFGRIPKLSPICCRNPNIKSSPLLPAFGPVPELSLICCRNPKPVHWGFR